MGVEEGRRATVGAVQGATIMAVQVIVTAQGMAVCGDEQAQGSEGAWGGWRWAAAPWLGPQGLLPGAGSLGQPLAVVGSTLSGDRLNGAASLRGQRGCLRWDPALQQRCSGLSTNPELTPRS